MEAAIALAKKLIRDKHAAMLPAVPKELQT
jgi:hypothetical protein